MSRDPEHAVQVHHIVRERIAQGEPVWAGTIQLRDLMRNEELTFEERRDGVVARLRTSRWVKAMDEMADVVCFLDELADTTTREDFEWVLEHIYREMDFDRIRVE